MRTSTRFFAAKTPPASSFLSLSLSFPPPPPPKSLPIALGGVVVDARRRPRGGMGTTRAARTEARDPSSSRGGLTAAKTSPEWEDTIAWLETELRGLQIAHNYPHILDDALVILARWRDEFPKVRSIH
jgi:hypothetical protein